MKPKQPRNLFRSRGRQRGNALRVTPFPEASYHDATSDWSARTRRCFPAASSRWSASGMIRTAVVLKANHAPATRM